MADDVIDSRASSRTATVVGMVLLCSLLANYLQRFNNSYWYLSDSILAICIGFLASVPFCSYDQYEGSRTSVQHARVRDTRVHAACRRAQMRDLLRELPLPAATILSDAQLAPGRGYRRPGSDFDTIFFLSEGGPTEGKFLRTPRFMHHLARLNVYQRVQVHCLQVTTSTFGEKFLRRLSDETGGKFYDYDTIKKAHGL